VTRHRITGREWIWALVLAAALALVITVGDPTAGLERGSPRSWLIVAAVIGPALGLCLLGARIWRDRPASAVLLAVVSGSSLGVFAVLTKGIVDVTEHGGHLLHAWEFYAWIAAGVAGMIFQQSAFRAGSLTSSLPTLTVAKPVVAVALGVTVLKETLQADGPEWLLLIAAAVIVIVATVGLARGEAATMAAGAGHDAKVTDEPIAPSERLSG
jgi:drug/metabolite transporter (DMT)-like permease